MRTSANTNRLRVVDNNSVEQRLKAAFPEIDLDAIANRVPTLNAHNVAEKWAYTVRQIEYWVNLTNT